MKINDWLESATQNLKEAGIATARLDSLILLEDTSDKDRAYLLAHLGFQLTTNQLKKLDGQVKRRLNHEPLAYIRGKSEFYGREFTVSPDTLEPRPETETMIELMLNLVKNRKLKAKSTVVDVGAGSGCLGITAKLELPELKVLATEVNNNALKVAKQNAKKLGANVEFYRGDLLKPVKDTKPFALLCNLPYVPDNYKINQAAKWEPQIAIFGGKDGLDIYRQLFEEIKNFQYQPTFIFTESLPPQHKKLEAIAQSKGYKLQKTNDFVQLFELANLVTPVRKG